MTSCSFARFCSNYAKADSAEPWEPIRGAKNREGKGSTRIDLVLTAICMGLLEFRPTAAKMSDL